MPTSPAPSVAATVVAALGAAQRVVEVWIPRLLLGAMVLVVSCDVVLRYVFGRPIVGAVEIAKLLFVWTVFLGGASATAARLHVGFEALTNLTKGRLRHGLRLLTEVIVIGVLIFITVLGVGAAMAAHGRQMALLRLPYSVVVTAIPVGCGLMVLRFGERAWESVRGVLDPSRDPVEAPPEAVGGPL